MGGPKMGGGSAIPASDRKLVQSLKEIVPNSEDEIYAMLKECNMDPNETAQRLLSEDTFHVVKRKRDKKKENPNNKEHSESRSRPSNVGSPSRGGKSSGVSDRGIGRGGSQPRAGLNELSGGGRGKPLPARENGVYSSTKGASHASTNETYGTPPYSQLKTSVVATSSLPSSTIVSNGGSLHPRPTPGLQGPWLMGSGHATMADIVKSNGTQITQPSVPVTVSNAPLHGSVENSPPSQQYLVSVPSVSGVYSSSSDPVHNPSLDPRAPVPVGGIKRDVGTVGNQRPIGDRASSFLPSDTSFVSSPRSQQSQLSQTNNADAVTTDDIDSDFKVMQSGNPPMSASATYLEEQPEAFESANALVGAQGHSLGVVNASSRSGLSPSQAIIGGGQFTPMQVYQAQHQPTDAQKASTTGFDWKTKHSNPNGTQLATVGESSSVSVVSEEEPSSPRSPPPEIGVLSSTAMTLHDLNLQDDQPVIIPDHLRVSEADCTRLSFGSFGTGFGATFPSSFTSGDSESSSASVGESTPVLEVSVSEQPSASSVEISSSSSLNKHEPPPAAPVDNLVPNSDVAPSSPATTESQPELTKPEGVVQPSSQFPYVPAAPSYPGFNLVPQMHGGQYSFERTESRPQDISRLPSVLQPYTDPTPNYYNGVFRSGPEGDARYPSFLVSGLNGKYNGSISAITGQSLSPQESGNTMALSTSGSLGQPSQSGNGQAAMTVPQQSLPIHAYTAQPSGLPLGPFPNVFSYQYVPPSFAYLHSPYQHSYTGNSGYHQAPAGSAFPSGGAAAVKYPVPQYKPSGVGAAGLHSAVTAGTAGYGGYSNSQSGAYAVNPTVTAGSATGYDDVVTPQYKDNSLYIPGHLQVEGSTMWVQQLSRDNPALQANSYYNLQGQSQHTPYSHTQPSHAHTLPAAAYGSLYHPQQSGPSQSAHQLLQQPQVLGAGGTVGTQTGSYQQPQRAQQTWSNNF